MIKSDIVNRVAETSDLSRVKAAEAVESATLTVLAEGKFRTADLAGSSTTCEVGDAIVGALFNLD